MNDQGLSCESPGPRKAKTPGLPLPPSRRGAARHIQPRLHEFLVRVSRQGNRGSAHLTRTKAGPEAFGAGEHPFIAFTGIELLEECGHRTADCDKTAPGQPASPLRREREKSLKHQDTPPSLPGPTFPARPQNAKKLQPPRPPAGPSPASTSRQRNRAGPRGLGARPPRRGRRIPPMMTAAHSGGRRRCLCFQPPHDTAFRSNRQGVRSFGLFSRGSGNLVADDHGGCARRSSRSPYHQSEQTVGPVDEPRLA